MNWRHFIYELEAIHLWTGGNSFMNWRQFIYELDAVHFWTGRSSFMNLSLYIEPSKKSPLVRSSFLNWSQFISELDAIHLWTGRSSFLNWTQFIYEMEPLYRAFKIVLSGALNLLNFWLFFCHFFTPKISPSHIFRPGNIFGKFCQFCPPPFSRAKSACKISHFGNELPPVHKWNASSS